MDGSEPNNLYIAAAKHLSEQPVPQPSQKDEEFRVHQTGAQRSTDADGFRFDLIPQVGLQRVAATMKHGMKYGAHNWRKGFAWSDTMNHAQKHLNLFLMGDRSEDHLAHAATNLLFLMEFEKIHPELNDLLSAKDYEPK